MKIEFVRTISKRMNFVPKYLYINADVGERLSNGTWTGFMGYLQVRLSILYEKIDKYEYILPLLLNRETKSIWQLARYKSKLIGCMCLMSQIGISTTL